MAIIEFALSSVLNSRRLHVSLLILQCLHCSLSQIAGYTNITFETEPRDFYATPSTTSASFYCQAKGYSTTTNQVESLDIRFVKNSNTVIQYNTMSSRFGYLISGNVRIGIYIDPVELSDDGDTFQCQVDHNGLGNEIVSRTARLTVGDGRPPALNLTEVSSELYSYTVSWPNVFLPLDGTIYQYNAVAYDSSDTVVHNNTFFGLYEYNYTFPDLQPGTTYKFRVIGINKYGTGDAADKLFEGTTLASLVPNPPQSLSFTPGDGGDIIVHVEPPVVDSETTTPITHYYLEYYQTSNGYSSATMAETPSNNPNFNLDNLKVGTSYTFNVTALNGAGLSAPIILEHTIDGNGGSATNVLPSTTTTAHLASTTTFITSSTTVLVQQSSTITVFTTNTITATVITTSTIPASTSSSNTMVPPSTIVSSTLTSTPSQSTGSREHSSTVQHHTTVTSSSSVLGTSTSTLVTQTTTPEDTVDNQSGTDGSTGTDLPFNAVVLAIGVIALVIMIAIIVAAILLVCFCIRSKKDNENFTDFHPSPWTHKAATNPKQQWDSKDSSIKGSPLSGSLNQSISDDIELPIDRNYLQNHSDSPPAIKDEDLKYGRRIEVEINGNGDPGFSSTVV